MIVVTFTVQDLNSLKKRADYLQFNSIDEFWTWLISLGGKLQFNLTKKKRTLTNLGWQKSDSQPCCFIQVTNKEQNLLTTVHKIVSNEGILFENIKHCSEQIIDYIALKYELFEISH